MKKSLAIITEKNSRIKGIIRLLLEGEFNFSIQDANKCSEIQFSFSEDFYPSIVIINLEDNKNDLENIVGELTKLNKPIPLYLYCLKEESSSDLNINYPHLQICGYANIVQKLTKYLEVNFQIDASTIPEEFTPINCHALQFATIVTDDVFIKLITGRMVKLFREGDSLTEEDVNKYIAKGVKELYFHRPAYKWILKSLLEAFAEIAKNPNSSLEIVPDLDEESSSDPLLIATSTNVPYVEENFFGNLFEGNQVPGTEVLNFEQKFLKNVHEKKKGLIVKLKDKKDLAKLVKQAKFDKDDALFYKNRINLLCTLSCALAKQLDWASELTIEKLIYVTYVHDITLLKFPRLLKIQNLQQLDMISDISEEEKTLFRNHPIEACEIVRKDFKAPQDADIMVLQHHETSHGSGFPGKLTPARITPMSCLFIVALDLTHYILNNPNWKPDAYIKQKKSHFKGGNFSKVFSALEKMLLG